MGTAGMGRDARMTKWLLRVLLGLLAAAMGCAGGGGPEPAAFDFSPAVLDFGTQDKILDLQLSPASDSGASWTASDNRTWMTLDPTSGSGSGRITVTVDRSGLSQGSYQGAVSIESAQGNAQVPVLVAVPPDTAAQVSGHVVRADDPSQPIAGARVTIPGATQVAAAAEGDPIEATTNAEGAYVLEKVPAGQHTLEVQPPSGSELVMTRADLQVIAQTAMELQVTLITETQQSALAGIGINPVEVRLATESTAEMSTAAVTASGEDLALMPTWTLLGRVVTIEPDGTVVSTTDTGSATILATLGTRRQQLPVVVTEADPELDVVVFARSPKGGNGRIVSTNQYGWPLVELTDGATSDSQPALSPDATRVAFSRTSGGRSEIWTVGLDASAPVQLTTAGAGIHHRAPSWAPDGSKLALAAEEGDASRLYTVSADGSGLAAIPGPSDRSYQPQWSPDGSTLVYTTRDPAGGGIEVAVVPAAGGTPTLLTDDGAFASDPAYSPDGTRIVFASTRESAAGGDIWTIGSAGGSLTRLTEDPFAEGEPAWSPDGSRILLRRFEAAWSDSIWSVGSTDGSGAFRLTSSVAADRSPSWGQMVPAPPEE
ncbi:MAG: hypothetical protein GF320_15075 [Armatimonadia bacterium]|nr:hypothetical protein [Armatimonadia bacterium]